ncbi:hypothetical protein [Virgibacillus salexigens]|uniref:Uncharacterized protein n=2 Tax=Virgibacillus TaxID=84406 RepID=A0A024QBY0_9BACI|nr:MULTISPECIES: hypothetical protein [Virgibacillus]GGJ44830.1 hypothetical protein GCM10007111_03550 [Virgibacillus kapii]CDQ40028.1 hypothetical protein BN990_02346 [Virgibacillus massiliensis]
MNLKRFLPAILVGYLITMLLLYFIFHYFSGFVLSSILGLILFALIITLSKKAN